MIWRGYQIYYKYRGKGEYTIILESGLGNASPIWEDSATYTKSNSVAARLEKVARVFSYDRYGCGQSGWLSQIEPIPAIVTVERLKRLLDEKQIKPPYILIGHSIGGLYMQLFAKKYPDVVAGVITVDTCVNAQMTTPGWERELTQEKLSNGRISLEHCEVLAQKEHDSELIFPRNIPLHVINSKHFLWGSSDHQKQMAEWQDDLAKESDLGASSDLHANSFIFLLVFKL